MRKIKHFAGYGTVMAGKINDDSCTLHVRVEGNHEMGLSINEWDDYLMFKWLVQRFDKTCTDYMAWEKLNPTVRIESEYVFSPKLGKYIDTCDYYFTY